MKRLCLALTVVLFLFSAPARATTPLLAGAPVAITGCSFATPVVCTTQSAHGVTAGGLAWIYGVLGGEPAVNGVVTCSSVTATTCTISGSVGVGNYASGGFMRSVGVTAATVGAWFDCSKCYKIGVLTYSAAGSTGHANVEGTVQDIADPLRGAPGTPVKVLATITNPASDASSANAYLSVDQVVRFVRSNVTDVSAGIIYAFLTCEAPGGTVW
jgi:hypothetical protein